MFFLEAVSLVAKRVWKETTGEKRDRSIAYEAHLAAPRAGTDGPSR
jgi:hypothetical protein